MGNEVITTTDSNSNTSIRFSNDKLTISGENWRLGLTTDRLGNVLPTIFNLYNIMMNDDKIRDMVYYDSFLDRIINTKRNGDWTDDDDSKLKLYIEKEYQILMLQKYYDAFSVFCQRKKHHFLKELIEEESWDSIPRIDKFLTHIVGCPDDGYHREVSRMIFYGAIRRLYEPGCKFDYMPIFIGKQGCGKSSLVKWLNMDDRAFTEISTIEGKEGIEVLQGAWICEMPELLAMVKVKEVEAMKSYITKTTDKYRGAYERRVRNKPRTCIFIGTTNNEEFLTDKTGNRRFLPIKFNLEPGDLYDKEVYIKDYIKSCWHEALYLYKRGKTYLSIPREYLPVLNEIQNSVVVDDPVENEIRNYLYDKDIGYRVCGKELFVECLHGIVKNFTSGEANRISKIMLKFTDWQRSSERGYLQNYGLQRYWERVKKDTDNID